MIDKMLRSNGTTFERKISLLLRKNVSTMAKPPQWAIQFNKFRDVICQWWIQEGARDVQSLLWVQILSFWQNHQNCQIIGSAPYVGLTLPQEILDLPLFKILILPQYHHPLLGKQQ